MFSIPFRVLGRTGSMIKLATLIHSNMRLKRCISRFLLLVNEQIGFDTWNLNDIDKYCQWLFFSNICLSYPIRFLFAEAERRKQTNKQAQKNFIMTNRPWYNNVLRRFLSLVLFSLRIDSMINRERCYSSICKCQRRFSFWSCQSSKSIGLASSTY